MPGNLCELPTSGLAREALREKGQFWTPEWIAGAMLEYVMLKQPPILFDPAVGAGAFFRAAKKYCADHFHQVHITGMEIDPATLARAGEAGELNSEDMKNIKVGDFILQPPNYKLPAIIANPPYIRHHRIPAEYKIQLKQISLQLTGRTLDGRTGLHVYFLLRALSLLEKNGHLAFIMPADTCEGKSSVDVWRWISANYRIDAVVTFAPEASPFPKIDTNPLIFFIANQPPTTSFQWIKCLRGGSSDLAEFVRANFSHPSPSLTVMERQIEEGIQTGLSRPPLERQLTRHVLGDFARVVRGVATGANDFFFLTQQKARQLGISSDYFVPAIGRTRDVQENIITAKTLENLQEKGRPTLLLSLDNSNIDAYPESIRAYLKQGEQRGLPKKPLISQRKIWYRMERRSVPPFLFAYLGRRNTRFIRNLAQVTPLTGFLCIYPAMQDPIFQDRLWQMLSHPDITLYLPFVGKSYGDGAIKVEPRSLERLPIPDKLVEQLNLHTQFNLFENQASYG